VGSANDVAQGFNQLVHGVYISHLSLNETMLTFWLPVTTGIQQIVNR